MNSLASVSSVSNRKWWSLFVLGGIKYISITQKSENDFPSFEHRLILISKKDNLDYRIATQLKYRLSKIEKNINYSLSYLGRKSEIDITGFINTEINYFINSEPVSKLGAETIKELNKYWYQKMTPFGICFQNNNSQNICKTNKEEMTYV